MFKKIGKMSVVTQPRLLPACKFERGWRVSVLNTAKQIRVTAQQPAAHHSAQLTTLVAELAMWTELLSCWRTTCSV